MALFFLFFWQIDVFCSILFCKAHFCSIKFFRNFFFVITRVVISICIFLNAFILLTLDILCLVYSNFSSNIYLKSVNYFFTNMISLYLHKQGIKYQSYPKLPKYLKIIAEDVYCTNSEG